MRRPKTLLVSIFAGLLTLFLPLLAIAIPEIQHWQTQNGARVYFVPVQSLPIVDVQVVFDAGSARDGERAGLAQLTNLLLDSGTAELSADHVAERLDGAGAQFSSGALRDMAWVSLRSLSEPRYLTPAIDTIARLLWKPAFTSDALERERNRMIAAVQALDQSPNAIAQRAFYQALYGDHPYGSPPEGTEASLKAITQEQVRDFHHRYYVAANTMVAIVGDLNRTGAEELANHLVAKLPAGQSPPVLPKVKPLAANKVLRIPYPSSQSHVYIGQVGMRRGDPDYYSLYLGNYILGGDGLISRLAEEVREKRGLSYSVYSYFSPMRRAGPFVMGLQTRNDQTDEAVSVMQTTLQDFVKNGLDSKALEAAQRNITGSFALRIDSNSKIVGYLAMIGFYQLPLDYLQTFTTKIDALSPKKVSRTFQQRVHPDRLVTVIVGGKTKKKSG